MKDEKILKNREENLKADDEIMSDEDLDGVSGGISITTLQNLPDLIDALGDALKNGKSKTKIQ